MTNAEPSFMDVPPPQDLEAERAILGFMMQEPVVVPGVASMLSFECFLSDKHQSIYGAILAAHDAAGVSAAAVVDELRQCGRLSGELSEAYVAEIASAQYVGCATDYAAKVRDAATARRLIWASCQILRQCYDQDNSPDALLRYAQKLIGDVADNHAKCCPKEES